MFQGSFTRSPTSALVPTFLGEGSPTKIDYRKKKVGALIILTSVLEDLVQYIMFYGLQQMGIGQSKATRGPQVLVIVSIYQGSILGTYF